MIFKNRVNINYFHIVYEFLLLDTFSFSSSFFTSQLDFPSLLSVKSFCQLSSCLKGKRAVDDTITQGFPYLGGWGEFPTPSKNLLIPPPLPPGKIPPSRLPPLPTKFLFPIHLKSNSPTKQRF